MLRFLLIIFLNIWNSYSPLNSQKGSLVSLFKAAGNKTAFPLCLLQNLNFCSKNLFPKVLSNKQSKLGKMMDGGKYWRSLCCSTHIFEIKQSLVIFMSTQKKQASDFCQRLTMPD